MISRIERKNDWQLAEELGEKTYTNLPHFVARSRWNADDVRDDLQQYVIEDLGSKEGILIVDETGFLKKGDRSVGVKRQYSGTAGRMENSHVGVFLAYRSDAGRALIDRVLDLPKEWAKDQSRRTVAKVSKSVTFSTKPQLAREMLDRALIAGVPAKWVTADEVYGSDYKFRHLCETRRLGDVETWRRGDDFVGSSPLPKRSVNMSKTSRRNNGERSRVVRGPKGNGLTSGRL